MKHCKRWWDQFYNYLCHPLLKWTKHIVFVFLNGLVYFEHACWSYISTSHFYNFTICMFKNWVGRSKAYLIRPLHIFTAVTNTFVHFLYSFDYLKLYIFLWVKSFRLKAWLGSANNIECTSSVDPEYQSTRRVRVMPIVIWGKKNVWLHHWND